MRRYRGFVDMRVIQARMNAADARFEQKQQQREARRQLEHIVARLAAVYTVETDQVALIGLVAEAKALMQRLDPFEGL